MAAAPSPFSDPLPAPIERAGCWPDPEQELLLQAALLDPQRALPAWREWSRRVDFAADRVDIGSYRLLPRVYRNLSEHIRDDPGARKLEGLYKRHWYENQLAFAAGAEALQALQAEGIETLLLKGWPLALRYYGDVGARPMSDLDLLVPSSCAIAAAGTLGRLGWQSGSEAPMTDSNLAHSHAHGFRRRRGGELDLHWHVLHLCQDEAITCRFREASVPLQASGVATRTLCTADHLLCVCLHGLMWSEVSAMRWIVDALLLIESRQHPVDWDRLLSMARACHGTLRLHAALTYLHERFDADIPGTLLESLAGTAPSRLERELYDTLTRGGNWRNARLLWLGYQLKRAGKAARVWKLGDFLEHVRVANGHRTRWQTLRWAGSRALARLARQAWPARRSGRA